MINVRNLRTKPAPVFVSVSKTASGQVEYRRYQGKTLTNHIEADRPLSADDVELYRSFPKDFLGETASTTGPEAA